MITIRSRTNIILSAVLIFWLNGCVSTSEQVKPVMGEFPAEPVAEKFFQIKELLKTEEDLSNQQETASPLNEEVADEIILTGYVFGKTKFEGVVKTSYVQLSINELAASDKTYKLIIGDKARQQSFPWETQTVKPGYFFIELPPGEYRISSITIPVGTSTATEPMDVVFKVQQDKYTYLGTMDVIGTREKIKLGGVPVIQPGFEYSLDRLDERNEALQEFKLHYSESASDFNVDLMRINRFSNLDFPSSIP
ncbi:MAG: hypothetical protein KAR05_01095 [Candidatus Omnitrophica bacterium]|nr:hypothetical protein [Candidatus Omnitrophota bacterium]